MWDSQTENNLNKNLALNQLPNTLKLETQKENTNDVYKFYYITLTNWCGDEFWLMKTT